MAKALDTIGSFQLLQKKISSGEFSPIYLLQGEESYFIDAISENLEVSILPESERSFNQSIVYGKELKMNDLVSMARRYPMMSKYQVIIVKEAKDLKDWDKLEAYLQNPLQSTILVFCYKNGKMDMRSKAAKGMAKFEVFTSEKLRDYQVKQWVIEKVKAKGRSIDAMAAELMVDFLGLDLSNIANELEKLFVTVKEDFIKVGHIEANVGMSRTYSVFELQKALGLKDFAKSIQIANNMAKNMEKDELYPMIAVLYKFFSKVTQLHYMDTRNEHAVAQALGVNTFFVGDYTQAARNYRMQDIENVFGQLKLLDLKLKGIHRASATDGQLFIEAIVKILKN